MASLLQYQPASLTQEQRRAVTEAGPLIVSASAGSGKTRVLVERYIRLLLEGVDVRRIVAMTFTRKAAAEMLNRVAERLDRLYAQAEQPHELALLRTLRERLLRATISTFHSYCSALLRRFPIEAAVPPVFSELSATDRRHLRQRAIRSIVDKWLGGNRRDNLGDLIRAFGSYREVERHLERILTTPARVVRPSHPLPYLERCERAVYQIALQLVSLWEKLLQRADEVSQDMEACVLSARRVVQLGFCLGSDRNAPLHNALNEFHTKDGSLRAKWKRLADSTEAQAAKHWAVILQQALTCDLLTEQSAESVAATIMELASAAIRYIDEEKASIAAFEPDDLQRRAVELLNNARVRQRLRWEIEHILVDEFQDTDPLEYELVQQLVPLHDPVLDFPELFIVGDPKQSIYGFRGADVRVFERARGDIITASDRSHDVHLQTSFRMTPTLVAVVNAIMQVAMPKRTSGYDVGYEELCSTRDSSTCPQSTVALLIGADANETATLVARHIVQITSPGEHCLVWDDGPLETDGGGGFRPAKYRDIALLARKSSTLAAYVQALRTAGIPFRIESGRGFYQTQEVLDVLSFLRLVHNRHDDVAVATFLRSPFVGLSDSELTLIAQAPPHERSFYERFAALATSTNVSPRIEAAYALLDDLLPVATRLPPTMLVRLLLRRSQWYQRICAMPRAEQIIANVEKLLEAARQFERRGFRNLLDFVEELDSLRVVADTESEAAIVSDDNVVTLMTIHAAKGLEFPIVYLLGTDETSNGRHQQLVITEELGVILTSVEGKSTLGGALAKSMQRQREQAEESRLLYVALTRAKDHLFIAGTIAPPSTEMKSRTPKSDSYLAWISKAFGLEWDSGYGVRSVSFSGFVRRYPGESPQQIDISVEIFYDLPQRDVVVDTEIPEPPRLDMTDSVSSTLSGEIISASQLLLYEHSPKEFYRIYRCGLPARDDEWKRALARLEREEDIIGTLAGKIIHRALEHLITRGSTLTAAVAIERALAEFQCTSLDNVRRRAVQDVEETLAFLDRNGLLEHTQRAFIEQAMIMPIGRHFLYGVPDVLIETAHGWEIWDWKTNCHDTRSAGEWLEYYRLQLEVYALLVAFAFPEQEHVTVRLIMTRPPVEMVHRTYSRAELHTIASRIDVLAQRIVRTAIESEESVGGESHIL